MHERERLHGELANLAAAVAAGGELHVLVSEIQKRQARQAELARLIGSPLPDADNLRASFEAKLRDWKTLLRDRPVHGQRVLRTLLDGPIQIHEEGGDAARWSATANARALFNTLSSRVASPAGSLLSGSDADRIDLGGLFAIAA